MILLSIKMLIVLKDQYMNLVLFDQGLKIRAALEFRASLGTVRYCVPSDTLGHTERYT